MQNQQPSGTGFSYKERTPVLSGKWFISSFYVISLCINLSMWSRIIRFWIKNPHAMVPLFQTAKIIFMLIFPSVKILFFLFMNFQDIVLVNCISLKMLPVVAAPTNNGSRHNYMLRCTPPYGSGHTTGGWFHLFTQILLKCIERTKKAGSSWYV